MQLRSADEGSTIFYKVRRHPASPFHLPDWLIACSKVFELRQPDEYKQLESPIAHRPSPHNHVPVPRHVVSYPSHSGIILIHRINLEVSSSGRRMSRRTAVDRLGFILAGILRVSAKSQGGLELPSIQSDEQTFRCMKW